MIINLKAQKLILKNLKLAKFLEKRDMLMQYFLEKLLITKETEKES